MARGVHDERKVNSKRKAEVDLSDSERSSESATGDSESDAYPSVRKVKSVAKRRMKEPRKTGLYASVEALATDETENDVDLKEKLATVDSTVLDRIRKALALAQHAGTGEHEARQALRLSTRLLSQVNLTQADVIAHETEKERQQRAGSSQVAIRHHEGKRVTMEAWSSQLAGAVKIFFDVQCYTESHWQKDPRIVWVFYGLSANTVAAALAFEMVYNQALHWAKMSKDAKGRVGKNSYLHGLADGLYMMAKEEKKKEEKLAIEAEAQKFKASMKEDEEQRRKEIARLQDPVSSSKRKGSGTKNDAIELLSDEESFGPSDPKWILFPDDSRDSKATKLEKVADEDEIKLVGFKAGRNDGRPDPRFVIKREGEEGLTEAFVSEGLDDGASDAYETSSEGGFGDVGEELGTMGSNPVHFEDGDDFDVEVEAERLLNGASVKKEADATGSAGMTVKKEEPLQGEVKDVKPAMPSLPTPPSTVPLKQEPKVEQDDEDYASWQSMGQLTLFRNNAQKIAEDYLKGTELKLRKGPAFREYKRDRDAYGQGKEDAKKVDFRRRRIEA